MAKFRRHRTSRKKSKGVSVHQRDTAPPFSRFSPVPCISQNETTTHLHTGEEEEEEEEEKNKAVERQTDTAAEGDGRNTRQAYRHTEDKIIHQIHTGNNHAARQ